MYPLNKNSSQFILNLEVPFIFFITLLTTCYRTLTNRKDLAFVIWCIRELEDIKMLSIFNN